MERDLRKVSDSPYFISFFSWVTTVTIAIIFHDHILILWASLVRF